MSSGNGRIELLDFHEPPKRLVSLVPSMTDSLYVLGAGDRLVAVTDFCPQPLDLAKPPARIGGTRSPEIEAVIELEPDLVIANQEENGKEAVEALEAAGLKVWVTFPRSIDDAIALLYTLTKLLRLQEAVVRLQTLEVTIDWAKRALSDEPMRLFCPIWRQESGGQAPWWMTFNRETYCHDVLSLCNGANIFADRQRRYPLAADLADEESEPPGERDTRYPRVRPQEVNEADPEVILLPSEPFHFQAEHLAVVERELAGTAAVKNERVHLVDGRLIAWHGTRLARALSELPSYFQVSDQAGTGGAPGA